MLGPYQRFGEKGRTDLRAVDERQPLLRLQSIRFQMHAPQRGPERRHLLFGDRENHADGLQLRDHEERRARCRRHEVARIDESETDAAADLRGDVRVRQIQFRAVDVRLRARLQAQEGAIAEAIELTQDFAALVRQRQPDQLETWLERATASGLQAFKSLANGLRADDEAVKAGVTLMWSTGPVEGQINRLKMLKRQMYGRAGIGLLRQRVLLPT